MKETLLIVRDLAGQKAWWGEPIDLHRIAKAIDARIPPPGTPERQKYVLELANYLSASVMGFTLNPDAVEDLESA